MPRIPRPAMALWHYLRSLGKLYGWIKIRVSTLMRKYGRSEAPIPRWLGMLRAFSAISSVQRGRVCCEYKVLKDPPACNRKKGTKNEREFLVNDRPNDRPEQLPLFTEPRESVSPTEKQNHPKDVASIPGIARKSAGFERLSETDRRWVTELRATPEAVRAGIIVVRARNAGRQTVRSLKYFAGPIAEAVRGDFPAGYVDYLEYRLPRYEQLGRETQRTG